MFFRVLVFLILIILLYRIIRSIRQNKLAGGISSQSVSSSPSGEDLVEDPVCHTYVPISQAYRQEISGRAYYFCGKPCYEKYVLEKNR